MIYSGKNKRCKERKRRNKASRNKKWIKLMK